MSTKRPNLIDQENIDATHLVVRELMCVSTMEDRANCLVYLGLAYHLDAALRLHGPLTELDTPAKVLAAYQGDINVPETVTYQQCTPWVRAAPNVYFRVQPDTVNEVGQRIIEHGLTEAITCLGESLGYMGSEAMQRIMAAAAKHQHVYWALSAMADMDNYVDAATAILDTVKPGKRKSLAQRVMPYAGATVDMFLLHDELYQKAMKTMEYHEDMKVRSSKVYYTILDGDQVVEMSVRSLLVAMGQVMYSRDAYGLYLRSKSM